MIVFRVEGAGVIVFRVFDISRGSIKTLYHGYRGSRVLPVGKWIQAERKAVRKGNKNYLSGWHVFLNSDAAHRFLKKLKIKTGRVIVPVTVRGELRQKSKEVWLADEMKVPRIWP